MPRSISTHKLRRRIQDLPPGRSYNRADIWYSTQKEHWLGWLKEYHSPGAYDRKVTSGRDARYAYNHVMNPEMLLYLVRQSGVSKRLLAQAVREARGLKPIPKKMAAIRRVVPWDLVAEKLWPAGLDPSIPILSIQQPWASLILSGKKTIENRPVPTTKTMRVYIYASQKLANLDGVRLGRYGIDKRDAEAYPRGRIVGSVEITHCRLDTRSQSRSYKWHLRKPRKLGTPVTPPTRSHPTQTFWYM
ncbi:MAG: ASCH domain-containing protein [Ignavibacteria bacterium]|nr:ASCH domain-containing protein [Ignavibacteria bacterium]